MEPDGLAQEREEHRSAMPIVIGQYTFDGPHTSTEALEDRAGVYAILCETRSQYHVMDIGESAQLRTRVENHDRQHCWTRKCRGALAVAVLYTPNLHQAGRRAIEQQFRAQYSPCCGKV